METKILWNRILWNRIFLTQNFLYLKHFGPNVIFPLTQNVFGPKIFKEPKVFETQTFWILEIFRTQICEPKILWRQNLFVPQIILDRISGFLFLQIMIPIPIIGFQSYRNRYPKFIAMLIPIFSSGIGGTLLTKTLNKSKQKL